VLKNAFYFYNKFVNIYLPPRWCYYFSNRKQKCL